MFDQLSTKQLVQVSRQIDATRRQWRLLTQVPRRERGAWVRPDLSESATALEKQLLKSYHQLGKSLLASLSGASDDISSGRLAQAKQIGTNRQEEEDALDYFDVDEDEIDRPVDKTRLAALLALLAMWKTRHLNISDQGIETEFARGRKAALAAAKRPAASSQSDTEALRHQILAKFEEDVNRLQTGLADGTARSYGIKWILENSTSVGQAAAYLRRLLDSEQYRIEMMAEAIAWNAHKEGERAGAIEATRDVLKELHPFPQSVAVDELTDEEKEKLPRYIWTGPMDSRTCSECAARFDQPVFALSINDLPSPEEICLGGRSCRHTWEIIS